MDILKNLKEIGELIKKYNNIEAVTEIIDIQQEILNMQNEMFQIKKENEKLKSIKDIEKRIVRHKGDTYITLRDDDNNILYCSRCWDKERKLVQLYEEYEAYICKDQSCQNTGHFNKAPVSYECIGDEFII